MNGEQATTSRSAAIAPLAMVGSAACWGLATVMSRDLLDTFRPTSLLVVQLLASLAFLALLALREHPLRFANARLGKASLAGLLEPGLTYSVALAGLALSTAGNASSIAASEPIIIALLAWVILRQRPSLRLGVGILIGAAGLLLISSDSLTGWADEFDLGGDLLLLLATFFAAGYVIVSSKFVADIPPATLAAAQQIVGLVLAAGILVLAEATCLQNQDWSAISAVDVLYAGASGIVQYALAFWLYLIGLKTLQPSAAGLWLALTPVFGILGGVLWLGEAPGVLVVIGAAAVIGGIAVGRPTGDVS